MYIHLQELTKQCSKWKSPWM